MMPTAECQPNGVRRDFVALALRARPAERPDRIPGQKLRYFASGTLLARAERSSIGIGKTIVELLSPAMLPSVCR